MIQEKKPTSRKKFVLWGLGILSSVTAFRLIHRNNTPDKKKTTVKLLGQDGKLVEVDPSVLNSPGKKITNEELKDWIKHK